MKIGDLVFVTDEGFIDEKNKSFKFLALIIEVTSNGEGVVIMVDGIRMLVSRSDCAVCRGENAND